MQSRWIIWKNYRHLVRDGHAAMICCPDDGQEYVSLLDSEDEPLLWCQSCDARVTMGIDFWDQIDAALKDAKRQGLIS